jgi:uncharacterized delta-60 repeat protein
VGRPWSRARRLPVPAVVAATLQTIIIAVAPPALAGGGDLDTSFGDDGKVITRITRHGESASAVAIQADGRIVVAGTTFGANRKFALARYRRDGRLDASFGGDGGVTTNFTAGPDEADALAVQADGKIVAAGTSGDDDFAVARYNPDGTLDGAFGREGKITTDFGGGEDAAYAVAIQADGSILVAGRTYNGVDSPRLALARFTTDGALDITFGEGGKVIGPGGPAYDIAIQPDGKILASNPVTRYHADGTIDGTFGGLAGHVMAVQPEGMIIAGWADGQCYGAGDCDTWFVLERADANGTPDPTFGEDGQVRGPPVGAASDIAIDPEGRVVVAVATDEGDGFLLVRLLADGSRDTAFAGDGVVFTRFGRRSASPASLAVQDDGKIVAVGIAGRWGFSGARFALTRYLP